MSETGRAAFEPAKHLRKLRSKNGQQSDYLDVKWRLVWLRSEHPDADITTDMTHYSDSHAVFKAHVSIPTYPHDPTIGGGSATGWGSETRGDFGDYLEKAETKALGRALAALGYGTQFADDYADGSGDEPRIADAPVDRRATASQTRQDAPRAANERTEDMATPKQITFAYKLARQVGISDDEMQDAATRLYGTPVEYLSKRDASAFIERMQAGDISTGTRQNEPPPAPRGTTITKADADEVRADAEAAGWTAADLNNWLGKRGLARMGAMTYAQRDDLRRDIRAMSDAALEPVEVEA